jgi:ferrous iron transport protein A
MNRGVFPLNLLPLGCKGEVCSLMTSGNQRRRMLDLGITSGTPIWALHSNVTGGLTAYSIRGAVIALRTDDAKGVLIKG